MLAGAIAGLLIARPAHAQGDGAGVCHLDRETRTNVSPAPPMRVLRASTVIVDTRIGFSCQAPIEPVHTMLVTDAALVATDAAVRAELAALPARLAPVANPWARLGRIDFGPGARTQCGLLPSRGTEHTPPPDEDAIELQLCLSGEGAPELDPEATDPSPSLADVIDTARWRLVAARNDEPPPTDHSRRPVHDQMLLLTAGQTLPAAEDERLAMCGAVEPAVRRAVADGIDVRLACADDDCARSCLGDAVTAATGKDLDVVGSWRDAAEELVGRVWATEARVWQLRVRESLNRVMDGRGRYTDTPVWTVVPGSLRPTMPHAPEDTSLMWTLSQPLGSEVHLVYHIRPLVENGTFELRQATRYGAVAFVSDTRGGFGVFPLDNPSLAIGSWGPFAAFLPSVFSSFHYEHSF